MLKDGLTALGAVVLIVSVVLFYPVVYFVFGALFGWILWQVFPWAGGWLVDGTHLFGVGLQLSDLPLFTATLAFIGAYFKSSSSNKK